ncbi:hypothetical protein [Labilibaculum euxinus]
MESPIKYSVQLSFEEIKLPPFEDILVLGINSPHGKNGISKSFELLIPNGFEIVETDHENIDCVFVNNRILTKMSKDKILAILIKNVFPFVSPSEIIKVDFKVTITYTTIEDELI